MTKKLAAKLRKVRLLILDVDGVLTDNVIMVGSEGSEYKNFHIQDGYGIDLLQHAGVKVAFLSGRYSKTTDFRARELKVKYVYNGYTNKLQIYNRLKTKLKLKDSQIAFMGDDLPDLPVLMQAGVALTVKNAQPENKKAADYVSHVAGGQGAVREIANLILRAKKLD